MRGISLDRSFAEQAYTRMYSSNFLFPSNHPNPIEIEDTGSVDASFQRGLTQGKFNWSLLSVDEFFKQDESVGKLGRAFLRMAFGVPICLIGAPLGAVCHGAFIVKHVALCGYHMKLDADWEKVKRHAYAFFIDLTAATWGLMGLSQGAIVYAISGMKPSVAAFLVGLIFSLSLSLWGLYSASSDFYMLFMSYQGERDSLWKSLMLKHYFGITGPGGKPLSWNANLDREMNRGKIAGTGRFSTYYWEALQDIKHSMQNIQRLLKQKGLPRFVTHQTSFVVALTAYLNELISKGHFIDDELNGPILILIESHSRLYFLENVLVNCTNYANAAFVLGMRYGSVFRDWRETELAAAIKEQAPASAAASPSRAPTAYDTLRGALKKLCDHEPALTAQQMQELRQPDERPRFKKTELERLSGLFEKGFPSDEELLDLHVFYSSENKQLILDILHSHYKKIVFFFHPDKNPDFGTEENKAIFQLIQEANARLQTKMERL